MRGLALKLPPFVVGMEVCWLYALGALFGMLFGHGGPPLSLPYVILLMSLGYTIAYGLEQLDFPVRTLRVVGGAMAALLILNTASLQLTGMPSFLGLGWLITPPESGTDLVVYRRAVVLSLSLGAVLWWRAVKLTQRRNTMDAVVFSFRLGLSLFALEALLELVVLPRETASWTAIPFFILSLWTFVLTREQESGGQSQGKGLGIAGAALGGVVIAGLVFGALPLGLLGSTASRAGSVLDDFLRDLLLILLFPLGLFMEALIAIIRAFLSTIGRRDFELPQLPESPFEAVRKMTEEGSLIPPYVGMLIKVTIILIVVGLVLLWLSRALRRRRNAMDQDTREVRESLWGEGNLLDDLKDLLTQFLTNPREKPGPPPWAGLAGDRSARAAILRVYYALLSVATSRGTPRGASQTPWEYLQALYSLFPINKRESYVITESFTKARYSLHEPQAQEASEVQSAWLQIQKPVLSSAEGPAAEDSR